jgi:hypothetical protein
MQWGRVKGMSLVFVLILGFYGIAQAGPFADEMSKCLVNNTNESDKVSFVQWMYAAMSAHPDVKSMSNIPVELKENINKNAAKMMINLVTVKCKNESKEAIKFEGESAFAQAFEILGKSAMNELMSDPNVEEFLSGMDKYIDSNKMKTTMGLK